MKLVLIALAMFWASLAGARAADKPAEKSLVVCNVTVIDVTAAAARPGMTLVVTGARIAEVGKADKVTAPKGARVVDGTGKYLIPGLWDMHVHIADEHFFRLCLANGVTGVRDMANYTKPILNQRKAVADGKLPGPRIVAAGPILDGPKPVWPFSIAAGNAEEGRDAVRKVKKEGVDFIKVYSKLPREAYFAIADEAKKQGLPFVGHVPVSVRVEEASRAGQKSIEHLTGLTLACSREEAKLLKEYQDAMKAEFSSGNKLALRAAAKAVDTYDAKKAAALFAEFKKNGTWHCPTLTVLRAMSHLDDKKFTSDPRLKYVSPFWQKWWSQNPKVDYATQRKLYKNSGELVWAMHRAGVELLAGTDTPNPYCFAGFSLHDELGLLVANGLTPGEALRCATSNPARFLGEPDKYGTVEKGKAADLVLLEADPLAKIENTRKIAAVVRGGKYFAKTDLQRMLNEVENAAKPKDGKKDKREGK
jgi:imidazolonepropionase-like amidohydrolase